MGMKALPLSVKELLPIGFKTPLETLAVDTEQLAAPGRLVLAEADAVDDLRDADDRDREGARQPEHDPERSPPTAGAARREHRREHREHAWGHGGAGPHDNREEQQQQLRELATRGQTITAMYAARKLYGCSLGEAKELVDSMREKVRR